MSLETDFIASKLTPEAYLRMFWDETELTEDVFADIDFSYLDPSEVEEAVKAAIRESAATPARRDFMTKLLMNYVQQTQPDGEPVFDAYCARIERLAGDDGAKREAMARMMTRVLRGELVPSAEHRLLVDVTQLLKQSRAIRPWQMRKDELIAREQELKG